MIEIHGLIPWGASTFGITTIAADSDGNVQLEAYRLVERRSFSGGEAGERLGFLHGEKVVVEGRLFYLRGPPSIFQADQQPPKAFLRTYPSRVSSKQF